MKVLLSCSFLLFFISQSVLSQEIEFRYFVDSLSEKTPYNIDTAEWTSIEANEKLSFGYNNNATVWCEITIPANASSLDQYWCFNNIHLDSISIYQNAQLIALLGDRTNRKSEYLKSYAIPLPDATPSPVKLIAAVKKQWSFIDFSISVKSKSELQEGTTKSIILAFSFFGFALILLTFNIYLLIQTKQKKYLYYLSYSSIGLVYVAVNTGVLKYTLFNDFLYFSEFRIFSGCYWYLFLGIFLSEILSFKTSAPRVFKVLMSFQLIVLILSIFSILCLVLDMEEWIIYPSFFVYLLFFVNILLLTIGVYRSILQKHTYAWYVVASFIPHILWGLNMILIAFQIIDLQLSVDWISVIILYEMLLFGWILIRDYIDAFRLNRELQAQLILEEKKSNDRIEGARIKERRMIADILHDKIGVDIAHTAHLIEMNQHSEAYNNLMSLGMNIRNLSHTILPKALEDGALVSALKTQIEIMNFQNKQTDISFDDYDFPKIVRLDFAYTFYLVSLELIQNAIRHGKAKNIVIEFYAYPNELILSFNDDGIGFDANEEFGFGLYNAQRRIKELNGTMSIDSTTEAGTSILISMPS